MTTLAGNLVTGWLYLPCTHRWRPWHPRWHRLPLTLHHTEGNGLGGTVTWAGR